MYDIYTLRRHFEKGISQSKCQENQYIIKLQGNYASGDNVVRFYWKNQTKNTVVPTCVSQQYVSSWHRMLAWYVNSQIKRIIQDYYFMIFHYSTEHNFRKTVKQLFHTLLMLGKREYPFHLLEFEKLFFGFTHLWFCFLLQIVFHKCV